MIKRTLAIFLFTTIWTCAFGQGRLSLDMASGIGYRTVNELPAFEVKRYAGSKDDPRLTSQLGIRYEFDNASGRIAPFVHTGWSSISYGTDRDQLMLTDEFGNIKEVISRKTTYTNKFCLLGGGLSFKSEQWSAGVGLEYGYLIQQSQFGKLTYKEMTTAYASTLIQDTVLNKHNAMANIRVSRTIQCKNFIPFNIYTEGGYCLSSVRTDVKLHPFYGVIGISLELFAVKPEI